MKFDLKSAWEHMHILAGGSTSHHASPPMVNMRLPDGTLATSNEVNGIVFVSHLEDVLNNNGNVDWNVLENLKQRRVMKELDNQTEWCELKKAITKLKNNKVPGLNGAPPIAFKSMDEGYLWTLFKHVNSFWDEKIDLYEWHEAQVVHVPKKGDLADPNKWRGVNLMDKDPKFLATYCVIQHLKLRRNTAQGINLTRF